MDQSKDISSEYYRKVLSKPHLKRTEFAVKLNESDSLAAIDCGCGTGSDIGYLEKHGYLVHGFDINPDSVSICRERFCSMPRVEISEASFESFDYPKAGIVIANSSLLFADPKKFAVTWEKINSCIEPGGVFAGDFMGVNDSWASNYWTSTTPLTEVDVKELFCNFKILRFHERDEDSQTSLGKLKHWHTYSIVAVKSLN